MRPVAGPLRGREPLAERRRELLHSRRRKGTIGTEHLRELLAVEQPVAAERGRADKWKVRADEAQRAVHRHYFAHDGFDARDLTRETIREAGPVTAPNA